MQIAVDRRRFLAIISSAGVAGLLLDRGSLAAEPPPETSTITLSKIKGVCIAPQYVAEELLRAEGFTDIRYVTSLPGGHQAKKMARGEVDFSMNFVASLVVAVDAGGPVSMLAGVHPGCFELIANDRIRGVTDLKGKTVGVQALGTSRHEFLVAIATYVGLDPVRDINWVTTSSVKPMELFAQGKIDAFLGFPPEPQELRARRIGHVVVNSALDRPWSQYFCCMLSGNSAFIRKNPVATKRAMRAILKAADLCVSEPEKVAQRLVEGKFTPRYDYALQALSDVPYGKWRDYDAEDTVRFYALRLREAGMIKSSPQTIIANGTDWRLFNELKRELKG
jgi:NitT/TauT family transport system substrate-binding protein